MTRSRFHPRAAARDVASIPELRDELRSLAEQAERDSARIRSLELRVDQLERALAASDRAREEIRLLDLRDQDMAAQRALLTNLVESAPVALRRLRRDLDEIVDRTAE